MNETNLQVASETVAPETQSRGMLLPCPCCGNEEATIKLNLADMEGTEAFTCCECEAEFGEAYIRDVVAKWSKMLAWLEMAPRS